MKISILLSTIFFSLSATDDIIDIQFNTIHDASRDGLYIDKPIYYRMPIFANNFIGITLLSRYTGSFAKVSASFYNDKPSEYQIYSASWTNINYYKVTNYENFTYPIEIPRGSYYLGIKIQLTDKAYSLRLAVIPYKSLIDDIKPDVIYQIRYYIAQYESIFYKMPITNNDDLEISIETNYSSTINFKLSVKFYDENPSMNKIINDNWNSNLSFAEYERLGYDYIKYLFEIDTVEDSKYLCIRIDALYHMDFMNLTVNYSSKLWILIVIAGVILFILLIIALFVLRKYYMLKKSKDLFSLNINLS